MLLGVAASSVQAQEVEVIFSQILALRNTEINLLYDDKRVSP